MEMQLEEARWPEVSFPYSYEDNDLSSLCVHLNEDHPYPQHAAEPRAADPLSRDPCRPAARPQSSMPLICPCPDVLPISYSDWSLKEEIDWIPAQANEPVFTDFRNFKHANMSLLQSPEEKTKGRWSPSSASCCSGHRPSMWTSPQIECANSCIIHTRIGANHPYAFLG